MASIRDIAYRAKVSIGTVDRVIHNRGRVSRTTRDRVERIVAELGYTPNIYGRNLSLGKMFQFGVVMPKLDQDSGYWRIPANGIDRAHRQLGAAKVRVVYFFFDRYSESSFERAFRKALISDLDGCLLAPVLPSIAQKLFSSIPTKIPYVFFDSSIPEAEPLTSIGQDPFQSGVLAASLMTRIAGDKGRVAIIKVAPTDYHIDERLRGFLSGIKSGKSIETVQYEADSHGGEVAFRKVAQRILRENVNLGGVFVSNAWTHPFAHFINDQIPKRSIGIIGYDLVAQNQKYLKGGQIDFIISQRPGMQGFEGIQALYRNVVLRDKVKKTIVVPLDIITKDNVEYYQD